MSDINQHTFMAKHAGTQQYYKFCKRLKSNGIDREKREEYYKNLLKQQEGVWRFLAKRFTSPDHKQSPIRNRPVHQKPPKHQIPVKNLDRH